MKYAVVAFSLVVLCGCTGPIIAGTTAAVMFATKPEKLPPADVAGQIPDHESWCYRTMADVQCYPSIQDVPPSRLVNVDPQSKYPVDLQAYNAALEAKKYPVAEPVTVEVSGANIK